MKLIKPQLDSFAKSQQFLPLPLPLHHPIPLFLSFHLSLSQPGCLHLHGQSLWVSLFIFHCIPSFDLLVILTLLTQDTHLLVKEVRGSFKFFLCVPQALIIHPSGKFSFLSIECVREQEFWEPSHYVLTTVLGIWQTPSLKFCETAITCAIKIRDFKFKNLQLVSDMFIWWNNLCLFS